MRFYKQGLTSSLFVFAGALGIISGCASDSDHPKAAPAATPQEEQKALIGQFEAAGKKVDLLSLDPDDTTIEKVNQSLRTVLNGIHSGKINPNIFETLRVSTTYSSQADTDGVLAINVTQSDPEALEFLSKQPTLAEFR